MVLVEHLRQRLGTRNLSANAYNDPTNRTVLQSLAKIAIHHDQISDAIDYLNVLAENPTDVADAIQIMSTLVEAYQAQGDKTKRLGTDGYH